MLPRVARALQRCVARPTVSPARWRALANVATPQTRWSRRLLIGGAALITVVAVAQLDHDSKVNQLVRPTLQEHIDVSQANAVTVESWEKEAQAGDAEAQYKMALCAMKGHHVPSSLSAADAWAEKAAAQGHALANYLLACRHALVAENPNMKTPGVLNMDHAWNKLGAQHRAPDGKKFADAALPYFRAAAAAGHVPSIFYTGLLLCLRSTDRAATMKPGAMPSLPDASSEAVSYITQAANAGHATASLTAGCIYKLSNQLEDAERYLKLSLEQSRKLPFACYELGELLYDQKRFTEAVPHLEMASHHVFAALPACIRLAYIYETGAAGPADPALAATYVARTSGTIPYVTQTNNPSHSVLNEHATVVPIATLMMARMKLIGRGTEVQPELAAEWLQLLVLTMNWPEAAYDLAFLYAKGIGVKKDYQKSVELIREAEKFSEALRQNAQQLMTEVDEESAGALARIMPPPYKAEEWSPVKGTLRWPRWLQPGYTRDRNIVQYKLHRPDLVEGTGEAAARHLQNQIAALRLQNRLK